VVGGRSTIAIDNFSPPLPSSRRFWHARRHAIGVWKHRGDSGATPGASFPGGQTVRRGGEGGHGVVVLPPTSGEGGERGAPGYSKVSTIIMRTPQQGHGGRWSAAAVGSVSSCSVGGSVTDAAAMISSLARAILVLQAALASNP